MHTEHTHRQQSGKLCVNPLKWRNRNSDMNYGFSEQINAMCVVSELRYFFLFYWEIYADRIGRHKLANGEENVQYYLKRLA